MMNRLYGGRDHACHGVSVWKWSLERLDCVDAWRCGVAEDC